MCWVRHLFISTWAADVSFWLGRFKFRSCTVTFCQLWHGIWRRLMQSEVLRPVFFGSDPPGLWRLIFLSYWNRTPDIRLFRMYLPPLHLPLCVLESGLGCSIAKLLSALRDQFLVNMFMGLENNLNGLRWRFSNEGLITSSLEFLIM